MENKNVAFETEKVQQMLSKVSCLTMKVAKIQAIVGMVTLLKK